MFPRKGIWGCFPVSSLCTEQRWARPFFCVPLLEHTEEWKRWIRGYEKCSAPEIKALPQSSAQTSHTRLSTWIVHVARTDICYNKIIKSSIFYLVFQAEKVKAKKKCISSASVTLCKCLPTRWNALDYARTTVIHKLRQTQTEIVLCWSPISMQRLASKQYKVLRPWGRQWWWFNLWTPSSKWAVLGLGILTCR